MKIKCKKSELKEARKSQKFLRKLGIHCKLKDLLTQARVDEVAMGA